jgi:hypothetical protein
MYTYVSFNQYIKTVRYFFTAMVDVIISWAQMSFTNVVLE